MKKYWHQADLIYSFLFSPPNEDERAQLIFISYDERFGRKFSAPENSER
jgi:hypothetical protein